MTSSASVAPSGQHGAPAVAVPTVGVDPRTSLASTLQSSRTTAVLLGSGASRAAGIPTGWEVTLDLIERVARTCGVDTTTGFDGPTWWREQGRGEPSYDTLVAGLARTDHDRRLLLRRYFEYDQSTGQPVEPTSAHHDLAALIARGSIPVVVTTNFDQLLEQALAEVGVTPQILSSPGHVAGRTPLAHAAVTLVKLHGDYATGALRNSPTELCNYPPGWRRLLQQIFDEYGLLVVGWSAQYDLALVEAMRRTVGRRYGWYWASLHGHLTPQAELLTTARRAHLIDTAGCDELFGDLRAQVANLDQIAARGRVWRSATVMHRVGQHRSQGWACMPCVVVGAAATLTGGDFESTGLLLTDVRAALEAGLDTTELTGLLVQLSARAAVSAAPPDVGRPATADAPSRWAAPPRIVDVVHGEPIAPHQSGSDAVLRCGGDGRAGVSAVLEVNLRGGLGSGSLPVVTVQVGLSVAGGVTVADVTRVQAAALGAVANAAVPALADVLPAGAAISHLETSWDTPGQFDSINRPVPDPIGLDLTLLGPPSRSPSRSGAYAEAVTAPFSPDAVREFLHRAWQTNAINSGYLDAQQPLTELFRQQP